VATDFRPRDIGRGGGFARLGQIGLRGIGGVCGTSCARRVEDGKGVGFRDEVFREDNLKL
jgi:hypothetical protein